MVSMTARHPVSESTTAGRVIAQSASDAATMRARAAGVIAWAASQSDLAGSGWHSMISASAPAASEATARDGTQLALPAAWLGSTAIGRSVMSRSTAIALTSRVFRVAVSNVLMPRAQRMTWVLPSAGTYFAA